MVDLGGIKVFALGASREYGERVSRHLEIALSPIEERPFEDGEHKSRPLVSVRNHDVYAIQSLYSDKAESVNDKLCKLLFLIGALKDASAKRVTAVVPYLGYARKDQKTQLHDPVTTKYVAAMFEAVGTDMLMTIDVHNLAAMQNAFRKPTEHLVALDLMAETLVPMLRGQDVAIVSPDIGGAKRASRLRTILAKALNRDPTTAFVEKQRGGGVVTGGMLVGDVKGRISVIIDDLIGSGTTVRLAADACRRAGSQRILVAATHGLFIGPATTVIEDPAIEKVLVTDTVPPFRLPKALADKKLMVLDSARLFADAIYRNHANH